MKIFDESGNYLGEFIEDKTDEIKENVKDSFDISFSSGCLMLLSVFAIQFPWLIIVIIGWLLLKLIWNIMKFIFRTLWWCLGLILLTIWWILRLPFTLVFYHELPDWWFPEW